MLALKSSNPIPFRKTSDTLWTLTVGPVKPDIYVYKFIIDGVTVVDPNNTLTGFSDQPGYNPKKKYPVLYLLGGSGELASTWALDGWANFIADNLIAEGKAVPMVMVLPNNQVIHRNDPNHTELTFKLFEEELRGQIVPFVDKNYSTLTNPGGRALAGLSMGGRHTQLVGFNCLDLFSSFGCLSSGDLTTEQASAKFLNDPAINKKVDYLLVGQGTGEVATIGLRAVALHEALQKHNVKHDYYVGGDGAHDWGTWRHLLYYWLLPNLWPKK